MNGCPVLPRSLMVVATIAFLAGLAPPLGCPVAVAQNNSGNQYDSSFREFSADMVPTPTELYRALMAFQPNDEATRKINEAKLKKLEEAGRDFFSKLSPEQQQNAWEYAEKFLKKNGLESPFSKQLMSQFGIPRDVQKLLAERYKKIEQSGNQSGDSFLKLLEQAKQVARQNQSQQGAGTGSTKSLLPENSGFDWGQKFREMADQANESVLNDPEFAAGPESFDGSSFQDILGRTKDTLARSYRNSSLPQERLTARFDRLLVKAAKRSLESKLGGSMETEVSDSVDSVFDSVVDKVHESVSKKKSDSRGSSKKQIERNSPGAGSGSPSSGSTAGTSPGGSGNPSDSSPDSPSIGDIKNALTSFAQLPATNPKTFLTGLAVLVLIGLFGYLGWRALASGDPESPARRFGRQFRNARIRTPKDLVEAVDFFLISKFGSESKWWNAKHARDVMQADAPEYSEKISGLFGDYARARYMRNEVLLSETEQQRYKKTLQELSRVSVEPAPAIPQTPSAVADRITG